MRILFFATTDFYRRPNPSFHLMVSMIEDILQAGHKVYFLGIKEDGVERHIPDQFENNPSFEYDLVPLPSVNKAAFVKRYLVGIKYAFKALKYIKKNANKCDVVFARSSPTVLFNLFLTKRCSKRRVILNIQDMFPGASIASGIMPNKLMQRTFYLLQKIAYKNADIIVAISEDMKTRLLEEGVNENKIRVIVNWFDDRTVHEVKREDNRFIKKYEMKEDKFYVQYAGTMGYVFDYKMVIAVAKLLQDYPDIVIQMIGAGSQKQSFMDAVEADGLRNVVFYPLEPQEMVADVYSACNVCLIPLKDFVIGNAVPSKAGLLMACKRAIVTSVNEDSDYYRMVNDEKIGIACSHERPEDVANAILHLFNNREECKQMGINGYEFGHNLYSRTTNMKKYLALFEEMSFKS